MCDRRSVPVAANEMTHFAVFIRASTSAPALSLAVAAAQTVAGEEAAKGGAPKPGAADAPVEFARDIQPIFQQHCVKCHGEKRTEAGLRLDNRARALAGGDDGPVIKAGKGRREPPDRTRIRHFRGRPHATGRRGPAALAGADQAVARVDRPGRDLARRGRRCQCGHLEPLGVSAFAAPPSAKGRQRRSRTLPDRRLRLRSLGEAEACVRAGGRPGDADSPLDARPAGPAADARRGRSLRTRPAPDAYERLVDRLLASPHYGERMGRHWLDVVGYADSNGYHRNDTPRPLAWRYRDYVIKSLNDDKPYDRFWLEQLAGDELVGHDESRPFTPEEVDCLVATHFLRNGPDGTDSTEGNEIARTIERYAVLEQQQQITISAMFALTIDCARCHSHKFDPIPQLDYYALQAIFYPAYNVQPVGAAQGPHDVGGQPAATRRVADPTRRGRCRDRRASQAASPVDEGQPAGRHNALPRRFRDGVARAAVEQHGGRGRCPQQRPASARRLIGAARGARSRAGALQVIDAGSQEDVWLCTSQRFDWTPNDVGSWIQVTFDLVGMKVKPQGTPAERVGYYIALNDYDNNGSVEGGDVLLDGDPAGGAASAPGLPRREGPRQRQNWRGGVCSRPQLRSPRNERRREHVPPRARRRRRAGSEDHHTGRKGPSRRRRSASSTAAGAASSWTTC